MSDDGGDKGGGGGSGDFSGGDTASYGYGDGNTSALANAQYGNPETGTLSYAPTSGAGADPGVSAAGGQTIDQFTANPTGSTPSVFDTGTSTVPNLSGPGALGGDIGTPGAGGGTNTPFAFDNSSYLSGLDQYTTNPTASAPTDQPHSLGGTTAVGAAAAGGSPTFDQMVGGAPSGTSAAATAAPAGVNDQVSTDLSSKNKSGSSSSNSGNSGSGGSDILKSLGIGNNGLGLAAAAAGLANNLINGNKTSPNYDSLAAQAANGNRVAQQLIDQSKPITEKGGQFIDSGQTQVNKGSALQDYVSTGKLPEGYESQVQEAVNAAKTRAISNAAASGQPTDPRLNTTLAASLDAIDKATPGMREQLAMQLATTGNSIVGAGNQTAGTGNQLSGNTLLQAGLQQTNVSSDIYAKLAALDQNKQQAQGQAIGNFAAALNGGTNKGLTLKVA